MPNFIGKVNVAMTLEDPDVEILGFGESVE